MLQAFELSYFCGKSQVEDDGTQNCLVFQPVHNVLKRLVIVIKLQRGNQKSCLMSILNLHRRQIMVLRNKSYG